MKSESLPAPKTQTARDGKTGLRGDSGQKLQGVGATLPVLEKFVHGPSKVTFSSTRLPDFELSCEFGVRNSINDRHGCVKCAIKLSEELVGHVTLHFKELIT